MSDDQIRKLASEANQQAWSYLEKAKLGTLGEDERVQMLSCASASLYLWARSSCPQLNLARAHWLLARVCCVIGEVRLADHHARLCENHTRSATDRKDFDEAYAIEALARLAALKGELQKARDLKVRAGELGASIADSEDRKIFMGDLEAGPWFGV